MNKEQYIASTIIGFSLYLISTGLSFALFKVVLPGSVAESGQTPGVSQTGTNPEKGFVIDPNTPKTAECPINGQMYTEQEKTIWEKNRPLAIMIENHAESRPQSGLSKADVVYEAVAEGGITRFMGVFYCGIAAQSTLVAPVRSARTYYLPWVLEYDALYNHVGGAGNCNDTTVDERAKALCQIEQYGVKDMDQFGIPFPTCYRNYDRLDHTVATEHTMVCDTGKLLKLASERGWTNVDAKGIAWDKNFSRWKFKKDADSTKRGTVGSLSFTAWKGYESSYGVRWDYDSTTNFYKRTNGGEAHVDLENKQQLTAKAVVVLFAKETGPVDDHAHLLYNTIGTGEGILFQDGSGQVVTWKKPTRSSRTQIIDKNGKEVEFNRGQIWFELLPTGTDVTY